MLSKEDLEYRRNKIGASDSGSIMGVNPWMSPLMLWEQKVGIREPSIANAAMQRGNDLEDAARDHFIQLTGIKVRPLRIEHDDIPYMFATYDGISDCGECIVEIKCPGEKTFNMALSGEIPEYYISQIQHQIEVVKPKQAFYFCFNGTSGVVIEVKQNKTYIEELLKKEAEFYRCMMDFSPPEPTFKDYKIREDLEWEECASKYMQAKNSKKRLEEEEEYYRKKLIELAGGSNSMGFGVTLSKGLRKGNICYSKIPQLNSMDLEKYRGQPVEYWRVN